MTTVTALPPILVVPCVETGRGGGHLARCATLVRDLRQRGREAFLLLDTPPGAPPAALETLAPLLAQLDSAWVIDTVDDDLRSPHHRPWHFIVLDRFQTPEPEYRFWSSLAPLVGIDEGGACRNRFDFLLDLLPGPPGRSAPNLLDPGLLPLPTNVRDSRAPAGPLKILVSFGAEDHVGLGIISAASLRLIPDVAVTLLTPRSTEAPALDGVTILRSIPHLGERLAEYDLLITHFGLTAFEAIHAGTPALLVSPSAYHEKLAKAAGFLSAGTGRRGAKRLGRLLAANNFLPGLRQRCGDIARRYGLGSTGNPHRNLADFFMAFDPLPRRRNCPTCAAGDACADIDTRNARGDPPVLTRFPDRGYRRCPRCGMVYMNRINEPPIEYEKEYFFEFYKKQYGKTYIEDFPNLIAMAKKRLSHILPLIAPNSDSAELLDIGCAYGPFLKAASKAGFAVCGIDPAEDAAAYVRDTLKLPAYHGFFPLSQTGDTRFRPGSFSVVSLWYVIEHFTNPREALEEAHRLLKTGGVLAFSTPSFTGISGRRSPAAFLEKSPADHFTIWSPKICRRVLKNYGFRLRKIVVSGHHPERFPLVGKLCVSKQGLLYNMVLCISRIFRLGDTFEVYAVSR